MKESYWIGGSVGGFVVFLWTVLSFGSLYAPHLMRFQDEAAVTSAIAGNAPESGVYLLPNMQGANEGALTHEELKARLDAAAKQWETGPAAVVVVRAHGMPSMAPSIFAAAITLPLAGLVIAWLLSKTSGLGFWGKVGFVVATAFTAGMLGHIPQWNFWGYPQGFTIAGFIDLTVGWFLGGLVIAKLCK